ncbi:MAG TPA: glycoside hydrolase family 20 zincin-like fold domain-containing protein [Sunxiuqinia sp.]|nr:glycoside hydrolase family 20 zincin-like fold domain-containing protein [Sunxiuqinia sp.]
MNHRLLSNSVFITIFLLIFFGCSSKKGSVIIVSQQGSPRESFGVEQLSAQLKNVGYTVEVSKSDTDIKKKKIIIQSVATDTTKNSEAPKLSEEGYSIKTDGNTIYVSATGPTGQLYGCLYLKDQVKKENKLPQNVDISDQPDMVMRGTCIGLQKTNYLPGRGVYEYPYTEKNFPWFYNKKLWIKYLDMMVENRYNSLYLWNGHPFASLVRLKDYPYAVEVDSATFKKNEEMFAFLTKEADKRGIWVIQMFYNIIVSKPFAEHNHLKTQDRSRPIIPIIADYTRKSITAFIEKYPHVGLLVTLGEAMNTIDDDVEWFTKTIIPGVKDGLDSLGIKNEPPIVLRAHDTDAKRVMEAALPIYRNLYTMAKYNGESLTTYQPRDQWVSIPKALSELGSVQIANVHILANLEPFRYGAPDFIRKSANAMINLTGAKGLHLYPQASYWDWPYTADKTDPRLLEMDRDWIWYKAWGRYAWKADRDTTTENQYWTNQLGDFYGCGKEGEGILTAYNQAGEIAPKLLRTFGISDGNRQTLLLGMFMGQLVNPNKYHVYPSFRSSSGPVKEDLLIYAEREWKGEKHVGETPPQIIQQVIEEGDAAVQAIDKAEASVTKNKAEFERLKNDMHCYNAFANFFDQKVKAAMLVLKYKYSNDVKDLEQAVPYLEQSLDYYKQLVNLTKDTYLYANSMQTAQRRIPVSGRDGKNKTWTELLPQYQQEFDNFKRNLNMLKSKGGDVMKKAKVLEPANVTILNKGVKRIPLEKGQMIYSDNKRSKIEGVANELKKLLAIQFSDEKQGDEGTTLKFKSDKPVKVLVGYFNTNSYSVLRPPTLENNANANDRGQADIKIANALLIPGMYPINVYTYKYEAGENELKLGKGRVLILGFIDGSETIPVHDAGMTKDENGPAVDWLFY